MEKLEKKEGTSSLTRNEMLVFTNESFKNGELLLNSDEFTKMVKISKEAVFAACVIYDNDYTFSKKEFDVIDQVNNDNTLHPVFLINNKILSFITDSLISWSTNPLTRSQNKWFFEKSIEVENYIIKKKEYDNFINMVIPENSKLEFLKGLDKFKKPFNTEVYSKLELIKNLLNN